MNRAMHEIRNHLAIAVANIEAFRDGVIEPSPPRLTAVLQALGEVDVLLRDIPSAADAPSKEMHSLARSMNVCEIVTNAILGLEAAAHDRGIAFSIVSCDAVGPGCALFDGDPVRIAEIVNNVVSNAIHYTPMGGRIDIDCRRGGGALTLTITDSGPGVRSDETVRIFEDGFRGSASRDQSGSGIGLSLVKQFVEEHGGSINVENGPALGAKFTVRLPGSSSAPAARSIVGGVMSIIDF